MRGAFGGIRRRIWAGALIAGAIVLALVAASTSWGFGQLSARTGTGGCIAESPENGGPCRMGRGLDTATFVAISPDGKNVYVAGRFNETVAVLDRDPSSGELSQRAGSAGCLADPSSAQPAFDGCQPATFGRIRSIAVSADGKNVYVGGDNTLAVLDRHPDGSLTESACMTHTGAGIGCTAEPLLQGESFVAVGPDDKSVYVTSRDSDSFGALLIYDRNSTTGALIRRPGLAGCITNRGNGGACRASSAFFHPLDVLVAPDGKQVYVSGTAGVILQREADGGLTAPTCFAGPVISGNCPEEAKVQGPAGAFAISPDGASVYALYRSQPFAQNGVVLVGLRRDPTSGLLSLADNADCVSSDGSGGRCKVAPNLSLDGAIAVSRDGRSVYASDPDTDTVTILDRDPASGALTPKQGAAGCISQDGAGGCASAPSLAGPVGLAPGPGNNELYAVASGAGAVALLDRDTSPDRTREPAPQLSAFSLLPHGLRLSGKGKTKGAGFHFTLNEAARVKISVEGKLPGRKVGRACKAPSPKTARRKRCLRVVAGDLPSSPAAAGANVLAFDGRLGGRPLLPGPYTATIRATDAAGDVSAPLKATFTVLAPLKAKRHSHRQG